MRIAIIGAGWFGCHIGKRLLEEGHELAIFEQDDAIFNRASGFNTGRLHLGFHYPRSEPTRRQSLEGFHRFTSEYGHLCEETGLNLYVIAKSGSLIDFASYTTIMKSDGIPFKEVSPSDYGFTNVEGAILTNERAINQHKAAAYFKKILEHTLRLKTKAVIIEDVNGNVSVNGELFDACINCSYLSESVSEVASDVCFENIVTPLFKPTRAFSEKSFVIMDGDFFSLNRFYTDTNSYQYSLYHVKNSVVDVSMDYKDAAAKEVLLKQGEWQNHVNLEDLLASVHTIYPKFSEEFEPVGCFYSIRTKRINENASRECSVTHEGRILTVLSGKINSVFEAESMVVSHLQQLQANGVHS